MNSQKELLWGPMGQGSQTAFLWLRGPSGARPGDAAEAEAAHLSGRQRFRV